MTVEQPSLARSRAWAPLGLMLVLACGAWFFRGTAWQGHAEGPGAVSSPAGLIQPLPDSPPAQGTSSSQLEGNGADVAVPSATQVLDDMALRGRQAAPAASSALSAESLQARVRQDAAAVHRQTAGQRMRLQGSLAAVEAGEPGVVVLHLALADQPGTVRVVASPSLAQAAVSWAPPKAVSLDCLSQGVMMGEWLLVDCKE